MTNTMYGAIDRDDAVRDGEELHVKDEVLDRLAKDANVAQFVSFGPGEQPVQRFAWVADRSPNHRFGTPREAVAALLAASPERSVNVRSFDPASPKSREFVYGLTTVDDAVAAVMRLAAAGLHTIVNETIDVHDGGISGVALGGVVEFAPGDTPRAVEKSGTLVLPAAGAVRLIETVYGFAPSFSTAADLRVEFSIHPLRRGFRRDHTIVWEVERVAPLALSAEISWPNRFSRLIGDKAFGLLLASVLDLPVPRTSVFPRHVPPFTFGEPTHTGETWIRTCPTEQVPGRYTTHHGWLDPFALLSREDPAGTEIASVLAQEGVDAAYSGALVTGSDGQPIVEGVAGSGESFMLGRAAPGTIPEAVAGAVLALYERARAMLGAVRFEWVYDGRRAWIVQLHRGATPSTAQTIFPGEAEVFHRFDVANGLEALRQLVAELRGTGEGVILVGNVGLTSHLGDILRRARIPSRLESP